MTDRSPVNPWEQRATAVASGFDPFSLTAAAARRRVGDAGLGRPVLVPVYLQRGNPGAVPVVTGLPVRLAPGGGITTDPGAFPVSLGGPGGFWRAAHDASGDPRALAHRDGWVRVAVPSAPAAPGTSGVSDPPGLAAHLVLRETDWELVRSALALHHGSPSTPQDAPAEQVLSRFLGRLDGEDGTPSAGLWGRLALEVVGVRHPGRLADTRSLRWHAAWGVGGFPAGSGGQAHGWGGSAMLLDLGYQRVAVQDRPFRVRTLPDWEREQAARDLGMRARRVLAWPVAPLPALLAFFADITPAQSPTHQVQDAERGPASRPAPSPGPQDAP